MTVLHVLEALRGGTSRHVVDVVTHAAGVDHHVAVPRPDDDNPESGAVPDRGALAAMQAAGATVHFVGMRRRPWDPANAAALADLRRLVRDIGPSVLHGHSSVGGALARLARLARATLPAGGPYAPGPPRVAYTPNGLATGRPYEVVERSLGPLTDRLVAVSDSEADRARALRLVAPERLVVIPNGIDVEPAPPGPDLRSQLGLDAASPLVGSVARLVPQKDPVTFVRVCAAVARQVPAAHFLLIGMGPLQAEVDAEVARCGLAARWHRLGHVERAAAVLGQLDVFVLASAFEGAPYTPLEAMRAATPVVLSDVVGNRDAVEDGVSGRLRPAGDVAGLADAVTALLTDPEAAARVGEAGRQRVRDRFDVRVMGARLAELYDELSRRPVVGRRRLVTSGSR